MGNSNSNPNPHYSVLPHILAMLRGKPGHSASVDEMSVKIDEFATNDKTLKTHIRSFESTKIALFYGIQLGVDMGLIIHTGNNVRLHEELMPGPMQHTIG